MDIEQLMQLLGMLQGGGGGGYQYMPYSGNRTNLSSMSMNTGFIEQLLSFLVPFKNRQAPPYMTQGAYNSVLNRGQQYQNVRNNYPDMYKVNPLSQLFIDKIGKQFGFSQDTMKSINQYAAFPLSMMGFPSPEQDRMQTFMEMNKLFAHTNYMRGMNVPTGNALTEGMYNLAYTHKSGMNKRFSFFEERFSFGCWSYWKW